MSAATQSVGTSLAPVKKQQSPDNRSYFDKLKDPRWQRIRALVLQRDGFTCTGCYSKEKTLHVHHCFYERGGPWDTHPNFLLTLCEDCHQERQEMENDAKRALGMIFSTITAESLRAFVTSICGIAASEGCHKPLVVEQFEIDYDSDCRWFKAAVDNPEMRPIYEKVIGKTIEWERLPQ